jgi:hypothetical protein
MKSVVKRRARDESSVYGSTASPQKIVFSLLSGSVSFFFGLFRSVMLLAPLLIPKKHVAFF